MNDRPSGKGLDQYGTVAAENPAKAPRTKPLPAGCSPLGHRSVLALDLATKCGWAVWKGGLLYSGSWMNPVRYCESPGAFFSAFQIWLVGMAGYKPEIVHWEMPRPVSVNAGLVAYGLVTRVQEWAFDHKIAQGQYVWPSQLKKAVTGFGGAGKDQMVAAMRTRWSLPELRDEDEADALAVLAWALGEHK